MLKVVNFINDYLSGYVLVFLLVAVGLFYSIKTRFVKGFLCKSYIILKTKTVCIQ